MSLFFVQCIDKNDAHISNSNVFSVKLLVAVFSSVSITFVRRNQETA